MEDTKELQELRNLYEARREQVDKVKYYESQRNPTAYKSQIDGAVNTADKLGKDIDEEIKKQGLSEKEYFEACEEWEQDRGHER